MTFNKAYWLGRQNIICEYYKFLTRNPSPELCLRFLRHGVKQSIETRTTVDAMTLEPDDRAERLAILQGADDQFKELISKVEAEIAGTTADA